MRIPPSAETGEFECLAFTNRNILKASCAKLFYGHCNENFQNIDNALHFIVVKDVYKMHRTYVT